MASIGKDANGSRRIQFMASDGRRRTIRLGKVSDEMVEYVKARVEHLVNCRKIGTPLDPETAKWLLGCDRKIVKPLRDAGLGEDSNLLSIRDAQQIFISGWEKGYTAGRSLAEKPKRKDLMDLFFDNL